MPGVAVDVDDHGSGPPRISSNLASLHNAAHVRAEFGTLSPLAHARTRERSTSDERHVPAGPDSPTAFRRTSTGVPPRRLPARRAPLFAGGNGPLESAGRAAPQGIDLRGQERRAGLVSRPAPAGPARP